MLPCVQMANGFTAWGGDCGDQGQMQNWASYPQQWQPSKEQDSKPDKEEKSAHSFDPSVKEFVPQAQKQADNQLPGFQASEKGWSTTIRALALEPKFDNGFVPGPRIKQAAVQNFMQAEAAPFVPAAMQAAEGAVVPGSRPVPKVVAASAAPPRVVAPCSQQAQSQLKASAPGWNKAAPAWRRDDLAAAPTPTKSEHSAEKESKPEQKGPAPPAVAKCEPKAWPKQRPQLRSAKQPAPVSPVQPVEVPATAAAQAQAQATPEPTKESAAVPAKETAAVPAQQQSTAGPAKAKATVKAKNETAPPAVLAAVPKSVFATPPKAAAVVPAANKEQARTEKKEEKQEKEVPLPVKEWPTLGAKPSKGAAASPAASAVGEKSSAQAPAAPPARVKAAGAWGKAESAVKVLKEAESKALQQKQAAAAKAAEEAAAAKESNEGVADNAAEEAAAAKAAEAAAKATEEAAAAKAAEDRAAAKASEEAAAAKAAEEAATAKAAEEEAAAKAVEEAAAAKAAKEEAAAKAAAEAAAVKAAEEAAAAAKAAEEAAAAKAAEEAEAAAKAEKEAAARAAEEAAAAKAAEAASAKAVEKGRAGETPKKSKRAPKADEADDETRPPSVAASDEQGSDEQVEATNLSDTPRYRALGSVSRGSQTAHELLRWRSLAGEVPEELATLSAAEDPSSSSSAQAPGSSPSHRAMFGSAAKGRDIERAAPLNLPTPSASAYRKTVASGREAELKRNVQSALNKICPENIAIIASKIEEQQVSSAEELQQVIGFIMKKALAEPHYSETYADLVFILKPKLPEFPCPEGGKPISFKSSLLNVCQNEFEGIQVINLEEEKEGLHPEEAEFERKRLKDRVLATMKWLGNLFLRQLLSAKIVGSIIADLAMCEDANSIPKEHIVECICELLTSIGYTLEAMPAGKGAMEQVCGRLLDLKSKKDKKGKSVYSKRVMFGVQDLLEARAAGWMKKVFKTTAKTKEEIARDQESDLQAQASGKAVSSAQWVAVGVRPAYLTEGSAPGAKTDAGAGWVSAKKGR